MLLISICRSIWNVKQKIHIYFQGWTYVLTLISHNNYWPSLQSYSLFFIVHYRQLLLAYFFPPHLHPHSDTLSFLISFWEVTGSGCRWAPGSSPGWRKHQSAGTAVPSHHYFSPYKKDFLLLWLTTATYWLPYTRSKCKRTRHGKQCESENYFVRIWQVLWIARTHFEGFQAMDQIGEEEPPGRSILTFSSPFLLQMLTTPFIIPRARYWPSFVHLW